MRFNDHAAQQRAVRRTVGDFPPEPVFEQDAIQAAENTSNASLTMVFAVRRQSFAVGKRTNCDEFIHERGDVETSRSISREHPEPDSSAPNPAGEEV